MLGGQKMRWPKIFNKTRLVYILFGVVFLTSGLIINFLQFLMYLLLKPISKFLYRKINKHLSYSIFSQLVFLEQYWADVKVTLHAAKTDFDFNFGQESAFLIMNHSYEMDWAIGWILCEYCNILGNVKTFAKKSLQHLPTIGFAWRAGGSIFVERNWEKDRNAFEGKLKDLLTYSDPFWLLLAAEGTRFTKEKHAASVAFARERGLPELRHHLTPRTKGFTSTLPIIKNKITAIYNVNVGIKPGSVQPTLTNILLGKTIKVDFYVERYKVADLPHGEKELAAWLHNLYKTKDDLLHSYLTTGKWVEEPSATKFEIFSLKRRLYPAINFYCWAVAILIPAGYFIIKLLVSGSLAYFGAASGIIGSFIYFLDKLVGETKISKGSSYGISNHTKKS